MCVVYNVHCATACSAALHTALMQLSCMCQVHDAWTQPPSYQRIDCNISCVLLPSTWCVWNSRNFNQRDCYAHAFEAGSPFPLGCDGHTSAPCQQLVACTAVARTHLGNGGLCTMHATITAVQMSVFVLSLVSSAAGHACTQRSCCYGTGLLLPQWHQGPHRSCHQHDSSSVAHLSLHCRLQQCWVPQALCNIC